MQREISIADDGEAGFAIEGPADVAGVAAGWVRPDEPIVDDTNPFAGGDSRAIATAPGGGTTATWTLDVPAEGDYEVYVAWVQGAWDFAPWPA